jgi:hypothetical protein
MEDGWGAEGFERYVGDLMGISFLGWTLNKLEVSLMLAAYCIKPRALGLSVPAIR